METDKDILIGYIFTLSNQECKKIYERLQSEKDTAIHTYGLVQLTTTQFNRIIFEFGNKKTYGCIEILNEWLVRKQVTLTPERCYSCIKGWVGGVYDKAHPDEVGKLTRGMKNIFQKAREYISNIPKELRIYDRDVRYYVHKFGLPVLEGIDNDGELSEEIRRYPAVHGRRIRIHSGIQQGQEPAAHSGLVGGQNESGEVEFESP